MRSGKTLLSFLVTGAAVIGLVVVIRDQAPSQRELDGLRAEVAALRSALREQARAAPRLVGSHLGVEAAAYLAARGARRPADEATPGLAPEPEERGNRQGPPRMTYEQSQATVLAAYADEAVDSGWSGKAAEQLAAVVRGHLPSGSQLTSLECRSTMCQVKVVHASQQAHGAFLLDGFRDWPGSIFVAGEHEERGELAVTLIAAREGTEPPLGPR